jgi:hypothetical protein
MTSYPLTHSLDRSLVHLGSEDSVADRPFTNHTYLELEKEQLHYMLRRLSYILNSAVEAAEFVSAELREDTGSHRVKIFNPTALRMQTHVNVVGFWGQRRADVQPEVSAQVERIDGQLVANLWQHPTILSYSSLQLSDDNWLNLVLLGEAAGKAHFHNSPLHQHVSQQLSPRYHAAVRLHNGTLAGGVKGTLQLEHTYPGTLFAPLLITKKVMNL